MKEKVLFFIFSIFILISCQTSNNINNQQSKSSDNNEIQEKPEIDKIKVPPKKDANQSSKVDTDVDEKSKESNVVLDKRKTKQISNKREKSNNDQSQMELNSMKINEYDLKELEIEVNKELSISLKNQGWKIKSISPNLIRFLKQDNYQENTLFQFKTYTPASINIIFTRDDIENKIIFRQPYKIKVLPKKQLVEKTKESNNVVKEKQGKTLYENEEDKRIKELADKYFDEKNYKDAKILYLQLLNKSILDPEIYYKLGIIEKESANTAQAYSYFKSALEEKENPFYLNALIELLNLLKDQKKYKEAIDLYYKYGIIESADKKSLEELYLLLADLYFIMKNYNNSSKEYNKFIKLFPYSKYSAKALFYLACSLENLPVNPDFKEAYRIYKIIIDQYPYTEYYLLSKNKILYLDRHYLKVH